MFYLSNKKFAVTKYRFGLIDLFLSAYAGKRKAEEEYGVIVPSKLHLFYYYLQREGLIISSLKGFLIKFFFCKSRASLLRFR